MISGCSGMMIKLWDFGGMDQRHCAFRTIGPVEDGNPIVDVACSNSGDRFVVVTTILAETKTNLEDLKYEALLLSLKRVYALLSDDVNTIGMELGRREGSLSLMFDISKGIILGNSIDDHGDEKLCDDDVEDVTKCRVFALKVISTASSYAPFV